jgi:hypothetical protein
VVEAYQTYREMAASWVVEADVQEPFVVEEVVPFVKELVDPLVWVR